MWRDKKTNKKPVIPTYPQIIPKGPWGKFQQLKDKVEPLKHQDILKISQKVPEEGSSNCTWDILKMSPKVP